MGISCGGEAVCCYAVCMYFESSLIFINVYEYSYSTKSVLVSSLVFICIYEYSYSTESVRVLTSSLLYINIYEHSVVPV